MMNSELKLETRSIERWQGRARLGSGDRNRNTANFDEVNEVVLLIGLVRDSDSSRDKQC